MSACTDVPARKVAIATPATIHLRALLNGCRVFLNLVPPAPQMCTVAVAISEFWESNRAFEGSKKQSHAKLAL